MLPQGPYKCLRISERCDEEAQVRMMWILALKMEAKEYGQPQGTNFLIEPPEGMKPYQPFDFRISDHQNYN